MIPDTDQNPGAEAENTDKNAGENANTEQTQGGEPAEGGANAGQGEDA